MDTFMVQPGESEYMKVQKGVEVDVTVVEKGDYRMLERVLKRSTNFENIITYFAYIYNFEKPFFWTLFILTQPIMIRMMSFFL